MFVFQTFVAAHVEIKGILSTTRGHNTATMEKKLNKRLNIPELEKSIVQSMWNKAANKQVD